MTDGHDTHDDAHTGWQQRYAESERIWSGRVNARLAEVTDGLAPGRALDLGAGEGADAIWLARAGWRVLRCGPAERDAIGPDDKPAHLIDNVIVVQRVPRGCRWPAAAIGTTMTSANELAGRPRSNPRKVRTSQSRVIANGNPG